MSSVRRLLGAGAAIALVSGTLLMTPSVAMADDAIPASAPASEPAATVAPDVDPVAESGLPLVPLVLTGNEAFSISPAGPWSGGQQVSVNLTGWTQSQLVVVLTCPKGVFPKANPPGAGCAPYTNPAGGSTVGNVGAGGKGSFKITVVEGKLDGTSYTCSTKTPCTIGVYGTDKDAVPANTPAAKVITYKSASSGSSSSTSSTSKTSSSSSTSSSTGTSSGTSTSSGSTSSTGALVNTGAGKTSSTAALGAAVLLLGSLLVLATRRRSAGSPTG